MNRGTTKYVIYVLCDPRDGSIRYVGKSCSGMRRPRTHVTAHGLKKRTKCASWLRSLVSRGWRPDIVIVDEASSDEELCEMERNWIRRLRERGCPLTNLTDGGEGVPGLVCTPEHRAKLAATQRGKVLSREHVAKIAAANRGRRFSQEVRRRMSVSKGGRPFVDQYGRRYETQQEAANILKRSQSHVWKVLNGKTPTCRGLVFRYIDD